MVKSKRKEAVWFFAGVLGIYVAMLSYLLFFNLGLELSSEVSSSGEPVLFLENSSIHLIREAKVSVFADGKKIREQEFSELLPNERKEINLKGIIASQIVIEAEAPFHLKVSKKFNVQKSVAVRIQPEIIGTKLVGKGNVLELTLRLCNLGERKLENVLVEERHSLDFFKENKKIDSISISPKKCKELVYSLTAKKEGKALIIFKVSVLNYSEKIEWEVEII
jgi:hypothetical protein